MLGKRGDRCHRAVSLKERARPLQLKCNAGFDYMDQVQGAAARRLAETGRDVWNKERWVSRFEKPMQSLPTKRRQGRPASDGGVRRGRTPGNSTASCSGMRWITFSKRGSKRRR